MGFLEVVHLLRLAEGASNQPLRGVGWSEQQVYVRAAIVLLAAHVEGFFRELPDAFEDELTDSWTSLRAGSQRYISLQVAAKLRNDLLPLFERNCTNPDDPDGVRRSIVAVARWFTRPQRARAATIRPRAEGFYRQRGARSVESLLRSFKQDGASFFDWLESRGFDRSRFWTTIEGLVEARNEIAHGSGNPSLTTKDARQYLAVCTVLIRQARTFVE